MRLSYDVKWCRVLTRWKKAGELAYEDSTICQPHLNLQTARSRSVASLKFPCLAFGNFGNFDNLRGLSAGD